MADSTGQLITASESTKKESDVTNSTWYKEGLSRVNMAVGSAYQNADGVDVISASGILNDGSDKVRVISADMTLDRIAIIVNSFIEMNDGFSFGKRKDIYNPWSITKYLDTGEYGTYWADTSGNMLISNLIRRSPAKIKTEMEDLLNGRVICTELDEQVIFEQLGRKRGAIWSLMLALTIVS